MWDAADANGLEDWVLFPINDLKNVIYGIIGKEFGSVVVDSIPGWKTALKNKNKDNKNNKEGNDSEEAAALLDLVDKMEKITDPAEMKSAARELSTMFKDLGEDITNSIMSAKIAEWKSKPITKQIRAIVTVLIKTFPELKGRFGNLLENR